MTRRRRMVAGLSGLIAISLLLGGVGPRSTWAADVRRRLVRSIELEDQVGSAKASAGQVVRQEMQGFGAGWSRNAQLFWGAPAPVDEPIRNWPHLTLLFDVPAGKKYEIILHHTVAPDYGKFRVFLGGQPVADIDGYAPAVAPRTHSLGERTLAAGKHQLVVTVFSKTATSKGHFVGLDRIVLR